MKLPIICYILVLFSACSTPKKYLLPLEARINKMKADSILYEKRIRTLDDEKNYLSRKCATIEQAYNNRLQEKQDSLTEKERILKDREYHLKDMKARKEEEKEAFQKLAQSVFSRFSDTDIIRTYTNCTQIIIEIADKALFRGNTLKPETHQKKLLEEINSVLQKNEDLQLIILSYTDSTANIKDRAEDDWASGSSKVNTLARALVKEEQRNRHRITTATRAVIEDHKKHALSGGNKTGFIFYSTLIPCIHNE